MALNIRIVFFYVCRQLWRVNAGNVHVRVMLYARSTHQIKHHDAVLATTESHIITFWWFVFMQYIHGIGQQKAAEIIEKVSIAADRRVSQLTDQEVLQIREVIDRDYLVEGDLRRETGMNIKRLMDLGCYRGLRHRRGLPVRGQRTHTNARTRKGPAKAIAGKKK